MVRPTKITPLFPFGFGLSYSQFEVSKLSAQWNKGQLQVEFNLANSGKLAGKELLSICPTGNVYLGST